MNLKFPLLLIAIMALPITVSAQVKNYRNQAGFQTDNDGYLANGSDRYYTAGTYLYFNHALNVQNSDSSAIANKILGFTIGQKIYNPYSAFVSYAYQIDRPFAGYLYIGTSLNLLYKNECNIKLEGQVGFVGPNSFAQQIQNAIHTTLGFYKPGGWQYQIQNDFEVNLSATYNQLLIRDKNTDLSFNSYAAVGNGLTGLGAGVLLRYGLLNYLYNSISTGSTVTCNKNMARLQPTEMFVYYKPVLNIVAYNATIQGSLFGRGPVNNQVALHPNTFVLNQQIGASMVKQRWDFDASVIFQSHEVKAMTYPEAWGSITVLYKFN